MAMFAVPLAEAATLRRKLPPWLFIFCAHERVGDPIRAAFPDARKLDSDNSCQSPRFPVLSELPAAECFGLLAVPE